MNRQADGASIPDALTMLRREFALPSDATMDSDLWMDLGFDSLAAIELVGIIEEAAGRQIADSAVLELSTIRDLDRFLDDVRRTNSDEV